MEWRRSPGSFPIRRSLLGPPSIPPQLPPFSRTLESAIYPITFTCRCPTSALQFELQPSVDLVPLSLSLPHFFHLLLCELAQKPANMVYHFHQNSLDGGSHLSPREEMGTSSIWSLVMSYFRIVRQMIQGSIPKVIVHLCVDHASRHVQDRLVSTFVAKILARL